jgi:hypothetical protein
MIDICNSATRVDVALSGGEDDTVVRMMMMMMQRAVKLRGPTDNSRCIGIEWTPAEEAPRQKEYGIGPSRGLNTLWVSVL